MPPHPILLRHPYNSNPQAPQVRYSMALLASSASPEASRGVAGRIRYPESHGTQNNFDNISLGSWSKTLTLVSQTLCHCVKTEIMVQGPRTQGPHTAMSWSLFLRDPSERAGFRMPRDSGSERELPFKLMGEIMKWGNFIWMLDSGCCSDRRPYRCIREDADGTGHLFPLRPTLHSRWWWRFTVCAFVFRVFVVRVFVVRVFVVRVFVAFCDTLPFIAII